MDTNNNYNIITKQEEGKEVSIMGKPKFIRECFSFLSSDQFKKLNNYRTKKYWKIQRRLRKINVNSRSHEYFGLYITGTLSCNFYIWAKAHKIPLSGNVEKLPKQPEIVSSINTPIYHLAGRLAVTFNSILVHYQ